MELFELSNVEDPDVGSLIRYSVIYDGLNALITIKHFVSSDRSSNVPPNSREYVNIQIHSEIDFQKFLWLRVRSW